MKHVYEINKVNDVHYLHGTITVLKKQFHYYVYCVDGLLIDTGPPRAKEAVAAFVEQVKPKKAFITHYHEDHSGNAAFLLEQFGIPIYTGEKTASIISDQLSLPFYRRFTWGRTNRTPVKGPITETKIQTENYRFQVVATPGHCQDHTSLIDSEKGLLFSGDLYLAKKLHFAMKEESIPQLIHSLEHILLYDFATLYCSHAGIVRKGKDALLEKKKYLETLSNQTIELYKQGYGVKEIAKRLLPSQKVLSFFSLGEMSPTHLIRSIIVDEH